MLLQRLWLLCGALVAVLALRGSARSFKSPRKIHSMYIQASSTRKQEVSCADSETIDLIKAYFGPPLYKPPRKGCLSATPLHWSDRSAEFDRSCSGNRCRIPLIPWNTTLQNRKWLICYECVPVETEYLDYNADEAKLDELLVEFDSNNESSHDDLRDFFKSQAGRSAREKQALAASFLTRVTSPLSFFGRSSLHKEEASRVLRTSEDNVAVLSEIVDDNETLQIHAKSLGNVTVTRSLHPDGRNVFSGASGGVGDRVVLPQQAALRAGGASGSGASLVSAVLYVPEVAGLLSGFVADGRNVSDVVAVTPIDASRGQARAHTALADPVTIEFSADGASDAECVFWNYDEAAWSADGCRTARDEGGVVRCECDHLSNFAVIMHIRLPPEETDGQTDGHKNPMQARIQTLTYIGSGLSILGLLAAVVFYARHSASEMTDRIRINLHFCCNLLAVHLLLMAGSALPPATGWCWASAVALHYALLATFAWSLLAAHQIYVLLVDVFEAEADRFRRYAALGYAGPAAVVAAGVAADLATGPGASYGGADSCWLGGGGGVFYACFLAPLALVLAANFSVLCVAFAKVARIRPRPYLFGQARGWLCLVLVLGGTWLIGMLAKVWPNEALVYAFAALNAMQGMLIFLFHVLLGRRCRSRLQDLASDGLRVLSSSGQRRRRKHRLDRHQPSQQVVTNTQSTSMKSSSSPSTPTTSTAKEADNEALFLIKMDKDKS